MQYGLKEAELKKLQELFAANGSIETVILYGSRAKGNYKPFSDVDITLVGNGFSRSDMNILHAAIDETSLPYKFDISILATLRNEELIDHINRMGIVIYKRNNI